MATSAQQGYSTTSITEHQVGHPNLPFTGADLGALSVVGLLLIVAGVSMKKALVD